MVAFIAIFAAALSGYAGVGVWAVALTAIALASLSHAEYGSLYRRGRDLGLGDVVQSTVLQSFGNALVATTAAYVAGWLLRLV